MVTPKSGKAINFKSILFFNIRCFQHHFLPDGRILHINSCSFCSSVFFPVLETYGRLWYFPNLHHTHRTLTACIKTYILTFETSKVHHLNTVNS